MVWPWRLQQCRTRQGFDVHRYTTVFRSVQCYTPELGKLCCLHLKTTNNSYCVDEISFKAKSCWVCFYHTVDSISVTLVSCSARFTIPVRPPNFSIEPCARRMRQLLGSLPSISMLCIRQSSTSCTGRDAFPRRALFGRTSHNAPAKRGA